MLLKACSRLILPILVVSSHMQPIIMKNMKPCFSNAKLAWMVLASISRPYIVHWDVDIANSQIENCVAHIKFITCPCCEGSAQIPKLWFDIGGLFTLWTE